MTCCCVCRSLNCFLTLVSRRIQAAQMMMMMLLMYAVSNHVHGRRSHCYFGGVATVAVSFGNASNKSLNQK